MDIWGITTPSFLVDLDILQRNIEEMANLCKSNNIQLWPMTKAHKSSDIVKMQHEAGAGGFLAGTLDEAENFSKKGYKNIMLAYPVAGKENIKRVIELAKTTNLMVSLDGEDAAKELHTFLEETNTSLDYLLIIDCGLHRFGVKAKKARDLAIILQKYRRLQFKGIATHPGQVYAAANMDEVQRVAVEEVETLSEARDLLAKDGFEVKIVATGSTPTARLIANSKVVTVLRPGNYVFYDNIQKSLGLIGADRCALSVLATVVSKPADDLLVIDAGSKCFGLDKGAHGNSTIEGFGFVKDHNELIVSALSEEVAKIKINGKTKIKVGDKLQIIPNHACSAANMTNYLIGYRGETLERIIEIDSRGGARKVKW